LSPRKLRRSSSKANPHGPTAPTASTPSTAAPVFTINKGDCFSFSYRRRHVHTANGSPIFTIKRESRFFQPTIYHALPPSETGARLFECQFDPWASGDKCTGHFCQCH
jgi:hypothetical protein